MFVETKNLIVKEGTSDKVVERFSREGAVEKSEGFVDLSVLVKKSRKGEEEVIVMIRWESEEAWKKWELSEAHLEGHRQARGKPKPDYLISSSHHVYEVKVYKSGR
ncbi:antibiotic biosynthesis monooxygenase [Brevibacillus sp. LEMMJ03]|uniref:Antibiotic biosynthesis monooxygenase n=1 Tax=Brevibacillus thermoruber TaxID=33942 RepID=A0A9X3TP57_9BACL|nr:MULTISPECIES: antibiotic biosynthesis monooxygenase [Brevibacillus]MDA5107970.1 antibiotic biosynthesis monooxygenase [Brevibacillus thermoruber]TRY26808.1 antibiotic biosynthesis monooxygenase [Brevibacillus sp. LEMMJ03]